MLIKPLLSSALETVLNQYLTLDDKAHLFLTPLADKVIAITIEPFNETLYLCPTKTHIQCLENFVGDVDTTLSGSIAAFGVMGLSKTPMRSLFSGDVKITGDTRLGQRFQQLFEQLEIDWEEHLSHLTGEVVAHTLSNLFRSSHHWTQETIETFKLNATEFLQEETRDLPANAEADIFYQQVDSLRMDFDRLCAHVNRLQTLNTNKDS
ncbi:MAG: SCP2 sterol-binding domain-containing protein [Methylococcales bacterium]|nr:SCP2 sterol-binding domain-containing protein [Methylococcales bacterium]